MGDFELNLLNLLPDWVVALFKGAGLLALVWLGFILLRGILRDLRSLITWPLQRAEQTRMFLDILESILEQSLPLEETLISLARSRDLSLGEPFHLVCGWLEKGLPLDEALAKVPGFLPAQITFMLRAGKQMGGLVKVLPVCRKLVKDARSQTWGPLNSMVASTFAITSLGMFVFWVFLAFVLPKFSEIADAIGGKNGFGLINFLAVHAWAIFCLQAAVFLFTWQVAHTYIGGPRATKGVPFSHQLGFWIPWRRRRMQRDFSTMLAVLLDAGVPEARALGLAADCSANSIFIRRAAYAIEELRQGATLSEAVLLLDDAGEFRWRLANAAISSGGFMRALTGWHESLDARAFQQEQAAVHGIFTALVLWRGLFVGCFAAGVFMVLISIVNTTILW